MTKSVDRLQAYPEHELEAAERMKWWSVFLTREQRRLKGIAQAIQIETNEPLVHGSSHTFPIVDEALDGFPEHNST